MGKSSLFTLRTSPFTLRRLIGTGNFSSQLRNRKRTSTEIKLQVVDTFRHAVQVKSSLEEEDDENEFECRKYPAGKSECKNGIGWWEPPLDCLPLDFCQHTSLHGLKYIGQPKRHMAERIFWLVAFLTGLCVAVYLISDVWRKYKASPVIVTFDSEETFIDKIPFPAVTICNMNKVLAREANKIIDQAKGDKYGDPDLINVYNLDNVCTSTKSFSKRFNFSSSRGNVDKGLVEKAGQINSSDTTLGAIQNFLQRTSQPCHEMIPLCMWHDALVENCSTLFRPIETDFGKCCTFNMVPQTLLRIFQNDTRDDESETEKWSQWNAAEGGLFPDSEPTLTKNFSDQRPRRQIRAGKSFGLSILLDPDLDEYFCTTSDSIGFRLSTHLSSETPHVIDFGLGINPNSEVFVDVRPEITTASSAILEYELEKRQCYFPDEYPLRYYKYYTVPNCIDECVASVTFNRCKCVRFYMPRDNNQSLCGPKSFSCVEEVQTGLADSGIKRSCDHCLPSCTEINYSAQVTSTPMQGDTNIWQAEDPENSKIQWARNKVSIVHIFFGTDSTYARVRKQLYGVTDLIANTGGLMGLCLGFSGLSAMEVLYFLSLRAFCRTRRKRTFGARVSQKFRDIWTKLKATKKYGKHSRENSTEQEEQRNQTNFGNTVQVQVHTQRRNRNRNLPAISSSESTYENRTFRLDSTLPDYNSVVNEINPYYTKRYWRDLERNNSEF